MRLTKDPVCGSTILCVRSLTATVGGMGGGVSEYVEPTGMFSVVNAFVITGRFVVHRRRRSQLRQDVVEQPLCLTQPVLALRRQHAAGLR